MCSPSFRPLVLGALTVDVPAASIVELFGVSRATAFRARSIGASGVGNASPVIRQSRNHDAEQLKAALVEELWLSLSRPSATATMVVNGQVVPKLWCGFSDQ